MIIEFLMGIVMGTLLMMMWQFWDFYRWGIIEVTLDFSVESLVDDMYAGHHRYGRDD